MIDNRSGNQLREKGYKQRIVSEGAVLYLSPVRVYDKGNLLKRKEADTERQQNMLKRRARAEHCIHGGDEEIIIFEIKQHAQIEGDCQDHNLFARPTRQQPMKKIIAPDTAHHNQQIQYVKITVKPKGHGNQENFRRRRPMSARQHIIAEQTHREK